MVVLGSGVLKYHGGVLDYYGGVFSQHGGSSSTPQCPTPSPNHSVWFCFIMEPGFLLICGTGMICEVPNPAAEENCLHFSMLTRKPNPCNDHIYHFHASESLNLSFSICRGGTRG